MALGGGVGVPGGLVEFIPRLHDMITKNVSFDNVSTTSFTTSMLNVQLWKNSGNLFIPNGGGGNTRGPVESDRINKPTAP